MSGDDKKIKILVVEDDEHTNLLISENLKNEGFQVFSVLNGEDAVRAALKHLPHLIMLDIMLPGLNGWEVCMQLRDQTSPARDIPIIVVSVLRKDSQPAAARVGPITFLSKPFDLEDLMREVRKILKSTGAYDGRE